MLMMKVLLWPLGMALTQRECSGKKRLVICGNNDLMIWMRFCGAPECTCLVCKVELRRDIRWEIQAGCPCGGGIHSSGRNLPQRPWQEEERGHGHEDHKGGGEKDALEKSESQRGIVCGTLWEDIDFRRTGKPTKLECQGQGRLNSHRI